MIYRKKDVYNMPGRVKAHHTVLLTLKNKSYALPIPVGIPTGTDKQQYDYYVFEEDGSRREVMLCVFSPSQQKPKSLANELKKGGHYRITGIAKKNHPLYSQEAVAMARRIVLEVKEYAWNTPPTCSGVIDVRTVTR